MKAKIALFQLISGSTGCELQAGSFFFQFEGKPIAERQCSSVKHTHTHKNRSIISRALNIIIEA